MGIPLVDRMKPATADTRTHPNIPRRDDAYLRDNVRVCPLANNTPASDCWWITNGHPRNAHGTACACQPPRELWGRGQ